MKLGRYTSKNTVYLYLKHMDYVTSLEELNSNLNKLVTDKLRYSKIKHFDLMI